MNQFKIIQWFEDNKINLDRLGRALEENIKAILDENLISYLPLKSRVKTTESAIGKVAIKGYESIEELQDACGLRIILLYEDDVEKVTKILQKELSCGAENKGDDPTNKYWYRGKHLVSRLPKKWISPHYKGLENYYFEIQIRTVTGHAWAEVEHQVSYKSEISLTSEMITAFESISLSLKDADNRFIQLKKGIEKLKKTVEKNIIKGNLEGIPLDSFSIGVIIDKYFKEKDKSAKKSDSYKIAKILEQNCLNLKDFGIFLEKNHEKLIQLRKEYIANKSPEDILRIFVDAKDYMLVGIFEFIIEFLEFKYNKRGIFHRNGKTRLRKLEASLGGVQLDKT